MSRLSYLDSARGIAILLIVWLHLGQNSDLIPSIVELSTHIGSFGLPLFFIVSGFLFSLGLARPDAQAKKILIGKIKSTLVPFYALSLLFIPMLIINTYFTGHAKSWQNALLALATFDISDKLPSGVLWFLFVLFLFFAFTLLITQLLGKSRLAQPFLWLLSIALLLAFPYLSNITLMGLCRISRGFFFFIFGFYALKYLLEAKTPVWQIAALWVAVIALFVAHFYLLPPGSYIRFILEITDCLLFNIALLLSCKALAKMRPKLTRGFEFLGRHSMSIFVFHVPSFIIFWILFKKLGIFYKIGADIALIALAVLVPLAAEYILAWMPPLHRILLGQKPVFKAGRGRQNQS